jgi:type I restriction enzyme, S subunit
VPVKEADRKRGPYPYYGASGVVDHVEVAGQGLEAKAVVVGDEGDVSLALSVK